MFAAGLVGRKQSYILLSGLLLIASSLGFNVRAASNVVVDSNGVGTYHSLDSAFKDIQSGKITPDTIILGGKDVHSYKVTGNMWRDIGNIHFVGQATSPDSFPIIKNETSGNSALFFGTNNNIYFERLAIEGDTAITTYGFSKTLTFKQCVIRNFTSAFFRSSGSDTPTIYFLNCLFVNNKSSIFDINYSNSAVKFKLLNCTFDNNNQIFSNDQDKSSNFVIANCIFSNNQIFTPSSSKYIKGRTIYSLVPDTSGYGIKCIQITNLNTIYRDTGARTLPSQYQLKAQSQAIAAGSDTITDNKTSNDLSGALRTSPYDIGCWKYVAPPTISSQPKGDTVLLGTKKTFKIIATGITPLYYAWYKVGKDSVLSKNDSLSFSNIDATFDSTSYYCVVSNVGVSTKSDNAILRVIKKPILINGTKDIDTTIKKGLTYTYTINATGLKLSYHLFENRKEITADSLNPKFTIPVDSSLANDTFYYVVRNPADFVQSANIIIHPAENIPTITKQPQDIQIQAGAKAPFSVVASGLGTLHYKWYKTDKAGNTSLVGADSSGLNFSTNDTTDNGSTFYCYVTSSLTGDSIKSGSAVLTVTIPPKPIIVSQSDSHFQVVGKNDTLKMVISGVYYTFEWYKDGKLLSGKTQNTLPLANISKADSGTYYCIIRNSGGDVTSNLIHLSVLDSGSIYNPLVISGTIITQDSVKLRIKYFRDLPAKKNDNSYVDTIGIWFQADNFPSTLSRNSKNCIYIPYSKMISSGDNTFDTIIKVASAHAECYDNYFIAAPIWKQPDSIVFKNEDNGCKIYSCDTSHITNPIALNAVNPRNDSISIKFTGINSLDRNSFLWMITYFKNGTDSLRDTIQLSDLPPTPANEFTKDYKNTLFKGEKDTLDWNVIIINRNGSRSNVLTFPVVVGYDLPSNSLTLKIDPSAIKKDQVFLSWTNGGVMYDSVRVWWDTQKSIPLMSKFSDLNDGQRNYITVGNVDTVTIKDLLSSTRYYFGAQIKKNDLWSVITENSSGSASTKTGSVIPNRIKFKDAYLDSLTNLIVVDYTIDTNGIGKSTYLIAPQIGRVMPSYNPSSDDSTYIIKDLSGGINRFTFDLGSQLAFNTRYYIRMFVKSSDGDWAAPTDSSTRIVDTKDPKWMAITYFKDSDSATCFENKVTLVKTNLWSSTETPVWDTLNYFKPTQEQLSGSFIPVSIGVKFVKHWSKPAVHFSLKIDSIPEGYSYKDIALYEFDSTSNKWKIIYDKDNVGSDTTIVSATIRIQEHPNPLMLMIDKVPPEIVITNDTSGVLDAHAESRNSITVKDNISNVIVKIYRGKGADIPVLGDSVIFGDTLPKDFVIPSDYISENSGLRALLVVTDGHFVDTINLSRKVHSTEIFNSPGTIWTPLYTHLIPDNPDLSNYFDSLSGGAGKKYVNTHFRIFRWAGEDPQSNEKNGGHWVEYGEQGTNDTMFLMKPGKLFWIKTKDRATINWGNGTTPSLKENYTIILKANSWNDFAVPFDFNIKIKDLLDSTGCSAYENDLAFCKWVNSTNTTEKDKNVMVTQLVHFSAGTMKNYNADLQPDSFYTVYNNSNSDIVLKIPPYPSSMSKYLPPIVLNKKENNNAEWYITLKARTQKSDISPIYFGYTLYNGTAKTQIPVAPSFSTVSMSINENDTLYGMQFYHNIADGYAFNLQFANSEQCKQTIMCNTNMAQIPSNMIVKVFDPKNGKVEDINSAEFKVDVDGNSKTERWLLAGSQTYIEKFVKLNRMYEFALIHSYPNPFKGILNIRYTLPKDGVDNVNCMLYDILGRLVWNIKINKNLHPGLNTLTVTPGENVIQHLATGNYLLKLVAKGENGNVVGTQQTKIMYFPR